MDAGDQMTVFLRVLLAAALGAFIGLERELRGYPAGARTMAIVALGSALFTEISLQTADADRIAAGIVSGIGFLGAGVIFREGYSVKGITTAATIWGAAALGMAVARELYLVATLAAVLIFFILESRTAIQWANNVLRGRAASITGPEDDGESDDKREHDER